MGVAKSPIAAALLALTAKVACFSWWAVLADAVRKGDGTTHDPIQEKVMDGGSEQQQTVEKRKHSDWDTETGADQTSNTWSWAKAEFEPDMVTTEIVGEVGTQQYRRFFKDAQTGHVVSPWHDLPLHTGEATPTEMWMVTEISKMTSAKYEIHTKERMNPIAQDIKAGKLRHYHGPIFWNYGFFPQTWEDPTEVHRQLHVKGDNDPLDVVEIGSREFAKGEVTRVKILGALAMIDHGELDWKVIAVNTEDELAKTLHCVNDLEASMPHVVSGIREWFRWYKAPDGKLNEFGFGGHALNRSRALEVIEETHDAWKRLRSGEIKHGDLWVGDDA